MIYEVSAVLLRSHALISKYFQQIVVRFSATFLTKRTVISQFKAILQLVHLLWLSYIAATFGGFRKKTGWRVWEQEASKVAIFG